MAIELTRRELYDLVWSTPMKALAADFKVSDVAVAKVCRKADIPVPGRGHWAKKEAGKPVARTPLPPRGFGMPDHVSIGHRAYASLSYDQPVDLAQSAPQFDEDLDSVQARAVALIGRVTVPPLSRAHPEVARLLAEDEARRQRHLAEKYPSSWNAPTFDAPGERRRLRIISAVFFAAMRAGGKASISDKAAEDCFVRVGREHVRFIVRKIDRSRRKDKGPLRLEVVIQRWNDAPVVGRWEDQEGVPVEKRIQEIVVAVVVEAERQYREAVKRRYEWHLERARERDEKARREEEERLRVEKERVEQEQKARVDLLLAAANALDQATRIRAYVSAVVAAKGRGSESPGEQLSTWAAWALREADRIDPTKTAQPERN
jgi:hypothetical protein